MFIYLLGLFLLLISAVFIFYNGKNTNIQRKVYLTVAFIILFIISGFRGVQVGTDTGAYYNIFNNVVHGVKTFNQEYGFILFNKFLSLFTDNPQAIILATSFITTLGIVVFVYYNSPNVWLSMFLYVTLYYYFFSFNAVRQFMAISIILIAFIFAKKQKFLPYFFMVLLATSFHTLAILGFVFYYIFWKKPKLNKIYKINIFIIFIGLLYDSFLNLIIKFFPRYSIYVGDYTESNGGIMVGIVYITIFIVALILKPKEVNDNYNAFLIISSISASLGILGYFSFSLIRPAWIFNICSIIMIPYILKSNFWRGYRVLPYQILITITVAYMFYYFRFNWHYVLPYYFAH